MLYLQKVLCQCSTTQLIEHQNLYDPAKPPQTLIKDLTQPKQLQTIQQYISLRHNEPQQLRLLGLLTTLILQNKGIEHLIEESLEIQRIESKADNWIFKDVITPYRMILLQCCQAPQLFRAMKIQRFDNNLFLKNLPFLVRIVESAVSIHQNVIRIGRYLLKSQLQKTYKFFGECYMILLGSLYRYMRFSLQNYLRWLTKKPTEINKIKDILVWIFFEVIPDINEKIRILNSNKYFDFQEKNLKIELFETEKQSSSVQKIIKQINKPSSKKKQKNAAMNDLESMMILKDGSFNETFPIKTLSMQYSYFDPQEGQQTLCELKISTNMLTAASESP